ncbi:hypothetical protein ACQP2F_14640 [Actinoplanes sp. CA-030573]|uniref:hypothetical protein n=1 Tax=Actinoplanes sp. CA-030573 TaxID=3239898 RepID=UPI003D8DDCE1
MLLGVVFLIAWAAGDHRLPATDSALPPWVEPLVTIVSHGAAGAVLVDRRPDLPFGWLLAGVAVLLAVQVVVAYPAADAVAHGDRGALARWGLTPLTFAFLPVAVQGLVNARFPTGRPATSAGTLLEAAIVAGAAAVVLGGFLGGSLTGVVPGVPPLQHPLTGGTPVGAAADALLAVAPVVIALGLLAGLGVVWRFLGAAGLERQQLKWRAAGVLVAVALFPVAVTGRLGFLIALDAPVFVLTLVVPVLRYRLWAIDTILRRSLAYAVIAALLGIAYVAVTAVLAGVASDRIAAPVAAAVVAVCFAPLARRVRRLVDRLFYGDRSDPYRTVRELGRRLNEVPHGNVLDSLVQAVASSLRLPYVAIERPDGTRLTGYGEPGAVAQRWPLAYERRLEHVLAAPRRGRVRAARCTSR